MTPRLFRNKDFVQYRKKYPIFSFDSYHYEHNYNKIKINFKFSIGKDFVFSPKMELNIEKYGIISPKKEILEDLIFNIGMVELVSYWKTVCSPIIYIKPKTLSEEQQKFWRKLYSKGLGEFFYQNGIDYFEENILNFEFDNCNIIDENIEYENINDSNRVIVPIGGGKDSVVTLEHFKTENEVLPFIINPRIATVKCAETAGYKVGDVIVLNREIDPFLLKLNNSGFLNGHTPFSALLAFNTLLVAYLTQTKKIALSNESSANEATIPNTDINHQYSKSEEFEIDFRKYVTNNMNGFSHYFSYLRKYNELQIAELFSKYPKYFPVFKSCNAGSKQDVWCCNCPKCLFTFIILAPFIDKTEMVSIFGENLLDKQSLKHYFDELTGKLPSKPFECVGTIDEVNIAVKMIKEKYSNSYLIKTLK